MTANAPPFQISHSKVLVTGANRGLGKMFVETLIERGATCVYAGARTPADLQPLIDIYGSKVIPVALDVTDQNQVDQAVKTAGDVTFLINNAGVLGPKGLMDAGNLDTLDYEMQVNVYGLARMCIAFAPVLKKAPQSAILNILSVASLYAFAPFGTYAASKAAAMSLTQSMAYELRDQGTSVFGAYAGFIDTEMINEFDFDASSPQDIVAAALDGIEAGESDIDTDYRSATIRALRNENTDAIRQAYWQRADDHYQKYPKKS